MSRSYQRLILQRRIEPGHLRFLGEFEPDPWKPLRWDYLVGKLLYKETPAQTRQRFASARGNTASVGETSPPCRSQAGPEGADNSDG